jgi:hypothetical protein
VAVKAAHFARPPELGLDGREHGDNIGLRRGSKYSIRTLQNADEKHGASTDFFNRCTWCLIPRAYTTCQQGRPQGCSLCSDRLQRLKPLIPQPLTPPCRLCCPVAFGFESAPSISSERKGQEERRLDQGPAMYRAESVGMHRDEDAELFHPPNGTSRSPTDRA